MSHMSRAQVASRIQHTLVAPDATESEIRRTCEECLQYGFDGAMIQPCWVPLADLLLRRSNIKVCTAFGYPMGGQTTRTKVFEMRECVALGAQEVDFLPNIALLKSGEHQAFRHEIQAVVKAAEGRIVKAMLEVGMLTDDEKRIAAELAVEAGVDYVKNSSGWGKGGGASVDDVRLLKRLVGDRAKVKASGGIRSWGNAVALLAAGADLLGTSAGVAIVTNAPMTSETEY